MTTVTLGNFPARTGGERDCDTLGEWNKVTVFSQGQSTELGQLV
jgi:hypothetical protein